MCMCVSACACVCVKETECWLTQMDITLCKLKFLPNDVISFMLIFIHNLDSAVTYSYNI